MLRRHLCAMGVFGMAMAASGAQAAQRTFVSVHGSDSNTASNCSNTAPCRGFAAALTVTDSGGEIIVQDSGGYGPVTINKTVSLIAPDGVYAGISVASGAGITISTSSISVSLRGLTLNGIGGNNGVYMSDGSSLVMQNCIARNFGPGAAVFVNAPAKVRILDSLLQTSYNGAYFAGGARVELSAVRILDNSHEGVYAYATGQGLTTALRVFRSEANGNGSEGYYAQSDSGALVVLHLKDSAASGNVGSGVYVNSNGGSVYSSVNTSLLSGNACGIGAEGAAAEMEAFGNTITGNGTGMCQSSSASLRSFGDNNVSTNDFTSLGTITSISKF